MKLFVCVISILATMTLGHAESADDQPASDNYPMSEPLFSRHVVPLFSRLGCNAGTCHGKVKGENGFRLSLFGVDPRQDHESLLKEFAARRVNLSNVESSLLLLKPTNAVPHGGGKLIDPGSPEYEILRQWLGQGAALDSLDRSRVVRMTVTPSQRTIAVGQSEKLRIEVEFGDGTVEDVTPLCRFEPVNEDVVSVDPSGAVSASAVGDSAIVVRYGAQPAVAMVVVPGPKINFPQVEVSNFIDKHVIAKLRRLNIPPADLCDDATFLRRASLDICGSLPEPDEIRRFLEDADPRKRAKKIDELLKRPGYSALWATKFCDLLRPTGFNQNFGFIEPAENRRFYQWIRARLDENLPYDEFAARILTATSREGRSFEVWVDEVMAIAEENARNDPKLPIYAKRRTLDLYWQRKDATGVKGTVQIAHSFLGLRMECAQCHRHPHDVWTQDDLLSFANFFNQVKGARYTDKKSLPEAIAKAFDQLPKDAKKLDAQLKELRDKKLRDVSTRLNKKRDELNRAKGKNEQGKTKQFEAELAQLTAEKEKIEQEVADLNVKRGRMMNGPKRFGTDVRHQTARVNHASVSSPLGSQRSNEFRLLGAADPIELNKEQDARELVVRWLRQSDNPFFSRAIVNRVWAHYFGRGIVDPPDHLSPLNPPSHPELLDELARKFIENKYNLKWLHRTIVSSRTYQQTSSPGGYTAARTNFAYFQLRRMPAEVLVDAVNTATGSAENYPEKLYLPQGAKAIEVAGVTSRENQSAEIGYAFKIFGRPLRSTEVQCDCERDTNATIVQTLYLANHPHVRDKIYNKNGRVAQIVAELVDDDRRIEEIYLTAVGRLPMDGERQSCLSYVQERDSSLKSFQDVMWTLLNTREFILNH